MYRMRFGMLTPDAVKSGGYTRLCIPRFLCFAEMCQSSKASPSAEIAWILLR